MNNTVETLSLSKFSTEGFPGTYDYPQYRELIRALAADGKVTGNDQSDHLLEHSKINEQRMNRWDKHTVLSEELSEQIKRITQPYTWLLISEGWCGDSAQIIPVLHQISLINPAIRFRIALREENPWLMDQYLSNGKRSIPILVCLDNEGKEIFHWGSRPATAAQLVADMKISKDPVYTAEQVKEKLHLWYARDKAQQLQTEILTLVRKMI